jgi:signal transduction histidine kinase
MAAMFVAMAWHAHRRQLAIREAERLAESEHRMLEGQREFVRDASHELRTPITIARGHAELIRTSGVDGQVAQDAEVVLDELGRLSRLSERLLLLTTAGDPRFLTTAEIDVEPFVVALMRRWTPAAPRAWQVAVGAEGTLVGDRERLETALDAILENAVKATGDGEAIRVGCEADGRRLVLEVADEGAGIRPEDLPRIFDRFATLGSDGSRNGGTGLGLSIAKAIVEAHGGTIAARSSLGRGTTVRIELPGFRRAAAAGAQTSDPRDRLHEARLVPSPVPPE